MLFGESLPKEAGSSSWANESQDYIRALSLKSMAHLLEEPERVENDMKNINKQMEDLAYNNFRVFLQLSECTSDVKKEMADIKSHCEGIEGSAPNFISICQEFCKNTQAISNTRRLNSKTLKQHPAILELLEIPQVMDTCIKNHHYDEALEIEKFVNRLEYQHSDIRIISDIVKEVKDSVGQMATQLHQSLSQDIDLPACIRTIGYLKKLAIYTDYELKVVFLQCRGLYRQHLINSIFSTNAFTYLSKVIDINRTQLIEISTQYNAIFMQSDDTGDDDTDDVDTSDNILSSWIIFQINEFLAVLRSKAQEIQDHSNMSILKSQCEYFGKSMSRIGADFRAVLPLVFEKCKV